MALKLISFVICIFLVANGYCSRSVPGDLKSRVRLALKLEKTNLNTCDPNEKTVPCPPSKFRSATGECNNILNRGYGARGDAFLRLLAPSYADDRLQPRTSTGSHALPAADFVIDELQKSIDDTLLHPHITAMVPAWGQLISYDLAEFSPLSGSLKCCKNNGKHTTTEEIDQCYVRSGSNCKEYKRSVPSIEKGQCDVKYRNQMNLASGFVDGSSLYGATEKEMNSLRLFRAGKVDIRACPRCTESGAVGALHTLLLKEHNRIATVLSDKNPTWSDSVLFLEARRALVAQIQHITYNEFLPIILGQQIANKDLAMVFGKHYNGYSSTIRPGVYNEIATSALPAFMTMLPNGMTNESTTVETLLGASAMLKTLKPNNLEFNQFWSPIALAIHRSRDHGIPPYYKALNLCEERLPNLNQKVSFNDLELYGGLSSDSKKSLEVIYQNAEDVDLLAGAILEKPALGTIFGPTLSCLLSIQFDKLRNGDRFWYENDIPPSSLNLDQLSAIRRVSLSGLMCTAGGLKLSQPKAFIKEDPYLNYRQTCKQLQGLDLSAWQSDEEPEFTTESAVEEESSVTPAYEELNESLIRAAIEKAKFDMNERAKFEYESWLNNGGIDARSPDGTAASFSKANRNAVKMGNSSLFFEFVSNEILNSLQGIHRRKRQTFDTNTLIGVFRDDFQNSLQNIDVNTLLTGSISPISLEPQCEDFNAPCDPTTPYRSMTAHCNNVRNPEWGKSLTTFNRLLPPVYEDGVSRPRQTSITGIPLPNPRTISSLIHPDISNLHTRYSLMVMQFAQFLDHDLTMTPIHKGFHESIPQCRSCDSPRTVHPECNPIPIPQGDHFYPDLNVTSGERMCFPFMRSLPGQQTLGPREQINQNTAFLDASQIYGENTCLANKLRSFQGRMNSTFHPVRGKELLPRTDAHPECKSPSGYCFIAGDGRASEQPGLTAIHTIFMREHNRLVDGLRAVNPHWDNEKAFQEARRIVSAQNQHITYNEFLPRLLSWNAVNLYGLKLLPQGYYKEYDSTCNPSIFTEFAAAAYRIGHSLLRPHIPRLSANHQPIDPPLLLRDFFFKMDALMAPEMMDEIARGLVATPMETLDQFITGEVSNHLFEDRRIPFSGVDLIALNVQRARDHGIPSYNNYRALCNLKRARTWEDLSREIPPEVINRFKRIYASVDDIDLFPGGMSERPLQGGLVGPTFACIIGIQFRQLRKCDRFWYETDDPNLKFTEAQLNEVRKTTLSKIICDNMDNPGDMQRAAFDLPSNFLNPRVPCHTMPQIDFNAWRENTVSGCQIGGRQVAVGQSAFPSPCTSCICTNEGAQCASLRITDCAQLAREWSKDAILADDICSAQCGLVLQSTQSSNIAGLSVPPSTRITRSRPLATWQTTSWQTTDFSLPDLTQFIG